jgi:hypothetical protein
MDEVAERGGIVVVSTAGSGVAMDQAAQTVTYAADPSGKRPVGVLMSEMVNLDLTRQRINENKEEIQKGGKVTVWNKCQVTTNRIRPEITVAAGDVAYVGPSGLLTNSNAHPDYGVEVGRFDSTEDENGYAKVTVNL